MIYFKITDKKSEAWERHQEYLTWRNEAFDQVKELAEDLGLETNEIMVHMGNVTSFLHQEGTSVPEFMRLDDKGRLLPDERYNKGKEARKRMRAIKFPTGNDYMEKIFGARGQALEGNSIYSGVGMALDEDQVLIQSKESVFSDARSKDEFAISEGCVEIKASEYHELREEMLGENNSIKN